MCNGVESNMRRKADSKGKSGQFSLLNVISHVGSKREDVQIRKMRSREVKFVDHGYMAIVTVSYYQT